MKRDIHPEYTESVIICSCGEKIETRSNKPEVKVEVCSKCHPFFTGKQAKVQEGGRVDKFKRKYNM